MGTPIRLIVYYNTVKGTYFPHKKKILGSTISTIPIIPITPAVPKYILVTRPNDSGGEGGRKLPDDGLPTITCPKEKISAIKPSGN